MKHTGAIFLIALLPLLASTATAQQTPNAGPGFRAEGVYDFGGIDNVSLFNGALSLNIPLGLEYPAGGGFSYRLRLQYHSTLWDSFVYFSPCPTPSECPVEFRPKGTHDAGLGWRLGLPRLIPPGGWNQTTAWIYVSADGSEHTFYNTLHASDADDTGDSGFDQLVRYSRDGSYLRFKRPSLSSSTITIELPGGHVHTFLKSGDDWLLTRMEDRFGNGVGISRGFDGDGNTVWTLDDDFREQKITFEDPGPSFPHQPELISKVELAAFDDTTATYTFNYATKTVNRPGAHNHPDPTDRTISVRLLHSIDLPGDNGAFVMGNVAGPAYNDQGLVTQLRLPTLGYLEWDWENYPFPKLRTLPPNQEEDEAVDPYNAVFGVSKRRQKGINGGVLGEWTYSRDFTPGIFVDGQLPERLRVTVHRPSGDKSEHYFSVYPAKDLSGQPAPQWGTGWNEYSLPYTRSESDPIGGARHLSSKIFDCDASGNGCDVVRSEYVEYELDDSAIQNDSTGTLFNKNRRLKSRRILDHYTDSGGTERTDWRLEVMSDFDGLGHFRSSTISSNYGPTRTSFTHFNEDRGTYPGAFSQFPKTSEWITGLFDKTTVTEGSRTEHEEFCFDEETGFLERHRILKRTDGNPSDDDLIQSFTADSRGQISAQFWFGGDLVPVGTAVDLCAMGLGTSSFRLTHTYAEGVLKTSRYTYHDGSFDSGGSGGPLTFYNVENTAVDPNTGLVKTSRAPSGISTSYTYDVLGRLRSIQPGAASGAAWTKIWFGTAINSTQPARAQVRELPNGSLNNNDALTEKRYRWDGLGRLDQERVSLPPGSGSEFSDRYHFYDGQGRRYATTTWGGSQATGLQQFDAFDRPRVIYPPDANAGNPAHGIELSYEGFRRITRRVAVGTELDEDGVVVETPVARTEEYDALGRLVAVTEPSGSGGANITTTYAYDLKDRLTGITMPVGGGQQQARSWTYDPRGFLTSECHPEKGGINGGGCTQYSLYNAMGQATQVVDGTFTRKYSYDRAGGRLTAVRDGGSRLLKSFKYGTSSSAANRANGQLIQAVNFQYPDLGAGIREQRFVEDFTYGGVGGARDHRQVSWIRQCEPGETSADCLDDGFCDEESFEHSEALDPTGKLASLTYPICTSADSGCGAPHPRAVDYTYDAGSGFLTGIPGWADDISYHSNMALNEIHHANGIVDVIGRDPNFMSRPSSLHVESAGGATLWESGTFRYDGAGNLLEMAATDFTDRFVYDGVSRLVNSRQWVRRSPDAGSEIFADGFESGDTTAWVEFQESYLADVYTEQTFTFDIPGNLLSVDTDGDVRTHSVSSTTNRLGGTAQYDSAGNLTQFTDESGQAVTFEYDAFNRLIYREQDGHFTHFLYTADDERILRFGTGGFSWSLRDFQGRVLREFRPESNRLQPIRDHIYRGSAPIATVTVDENDILSKRHHLSLDHLGSPRYVTDGAGNFIAEHKYYPFGEEATRPAQNDLPLKFTGHERDFYADGARDDLDYMHARFCDPRVGRFLSVDPQEASANPALPQSLNRYSYVLNNPTRFTDPTGEIVDLSNLDEAQQGQLLQGLEAFTGNQYEVDENGHLQLVATGESGSDIATSFLSDLISSEAEFSVQASLTGHNRANIATGSIEMNFDSFVGARFPRGVDSRTFNLGSTFVHEMYHVYSGELDHEDGVIRYTTDWTGPVVDFVNTIRKERGFAIRSSYVGVYSGNSKYQLVNFVDPNRPRRTRKVKRLIDR